MITFVTILGLINAVLIFIRFEVGLYLFFTIVPLSVLFPASPIKGLNGTTILILLLFYKSFSQPKTAVIADGIKDLKVPIYGLFFVTFFSIIFSTILYEHQTLPLIKYFEKMWRWLLYIFLYFVCRRELVTKKMIIYALTAISIGLFIEGGFVLKAYVLAGRLRSYGTFANSNELAQFFSSYFLVSVALLLFEKRLIHKLFFSGAVLLTLFGIVSSLSRGGFLCTIMAAAVFVFFRSKKIFIFLVVICSLSFGTFYNLLPDKVTDRIEETFVEETEHRRYGDSTLGGVGIEGSAFSRIPLIKGGMVMFKENPLFGKGFMSFPRLIHRFKYGGQYGIEPGHVKASHNMHIRILSELGLVGYFFFLLIFYYSIRMGYALFKIGSDQFEKDTGIVFICIALTFLVGCLFGDRFFRGILTTYYFVVASCVYNLYCLNSSKKYEDKTI